MTTNPEVNRLYAAWRRLGVNFSVASCTDMDHVGAGRAPQYEAALAHCKPLRRPRALYDNIEALPAFRDWARTHSLPVYRRWGFWHDDVMLKLVSVHPLARILKVPELRARALCGRGDTNVAARLR